MIRKNELQFNGLAKTLNLSYRLLLITFENNMIQATKIFVCPTRINDFRVCDFLSQVLTVFQNELKLLADQWYNYPKGIDGNPGYNDVFALIERSNVGLFNNAVIVLFPVMQFCRNFRFASWNEDMLRA